MKLIITLNFWASGAPIELERLAELPTDNLQIDEAHILGNQLCELYDTCEHYKTITDNNKHVSINYDFEA